MLGNLLWLFSILCAQFWLIHPLRFPSYDLILSYFSILVFMQKVIFHDILWYQIGPTSQNREFDRTYGILQNQLPITSFPSEKNMPFTGYTIRPQANLHVPWSKHGERVAILGDAYESIWIHHHGVCNGLHVHESDFDSWWGWLKYPICLGQLSVNPISSTRQWSVDIPGVWRVGLMWADRTSKMSAGVFWAHLSIDCFKGQITG